MLAALRSGNYKDNLLGTSHGSASTEAEEDASSDEEDEQAESSSSKATTPPKEPLPLKNAQPKTFAGFDVDDEFMSSDDEVERK